MVGKYLKKKLVQDLEIRNFFNIFAPQEKRKKLFLLTFKETLT